VSASGRGRKGAIGGVRMLVDFEPNEGGEIEDLFGQLWWVPSSPLPRVGPLLLNRFWIKHDLWESKLFEPKDCFCV
jgi:hypothetical protein